MFVLSLSVALFLTVSLWARERYLRVWYSTYADNIDKLLASLKAELNRLASELEAERSKKASQTLDRLDRWLDEECEGSNYLTYTISPYRVKLYDSTGETGEAAVFAYRSPADMSSYHHGFDADCLPDNAVLPPGATDDAPASTSAAILAALKLWDARKLAMQQPKPADAVETEKAEKAEEAGTGREAT